jgi:hypothetical protein
MTHAQEQTQKLETIEKKCIPLARKALYAEHNKALWHDNCFRGKAISITNSECVFSFNFPTRKWHASCYIVIFG